MSALKFFEVILFVSAPPPEGGTPNLHPLLKFGLQFAEAGERLRTAVYRVRSSAFGRSEAIMRIAAFPGIERILEPIPRYD
jgi:hypothetical protein